MRSWLILGTLLAFACSQISVQGHPAQGLVVEGQGGFTDSFSNDGSLNTSLWTTRSNLLKEVAAAGEGGNQCFSLANGFVSPILSFGPNGMEMSGTTGLQQFTGIQSSRTFSPPFEFRTTVTATVASGNPWEIFFVSPDGRQWFSLYGNVNPSNQPYVGIKLGCGVIYGQPALNVPYTIDVTASASGLFSVSLSSGSATLAKSSVQVGAGPFYLILGQGEGWPNTPGTKNVAFWHSVTVANGRIAATAPAVTLYAPVTNGLAVTLNGVATATTPGATITQIAWNWGDGSVQEIGSFPETHVYAGPGSYNITVTATDSSSLTGSARTGAELTTSGPSTAKLWVAEVQTSPGERTAGQVNLAWDDPGAKNCELRVSPSIQNLAKGVSVPVVCTGAGTRWWASIPPNLPSVGNPLPNPIQYTFSLDDNVGTAHAPDPVSVYALPHLVYGKAGESFNSLIRYPNLGPCSSPQFPQLKCWWPFGYSDDECLDSTTSCPSDAARSQGKASAGIIGFGIFGSGQVQDSLMAVYGKSFSLPEGYAEDLTVNTKVSYNALGGCFAALGADAVDFEVAVTDNVSPVADAVAFPTPSPNTLCIGAGLAGPISEMLNGAIGLAQLLQDSPQLLSDVNSLETAYASQNVAAEFEDLSNVLSDLGALKGVGFATSSAPGISEGWSLIVSSPCTYELEVIPTVAFRSAGAGLVGGQVLKTVSSVTISGIAAPSSGAVSACYSPTASTSLNPTSLGGNSRSPTRAQPPVSTVGGVVSVSVSPSRVPSGGQFTVSGIARRTSGVAIAGARVQISASIDGSTLPLTTATTASDGSFSAVLFAPPVAGNVVITATIAGTSPPIQATATITVTAAQ